MRKRFSDEDVAFLKDSYGKLTPAAIAQQLDRKVADVYTKAYALGLTKKRKHEPVATA